MAENNVFIDNILDEMKSCISTA